MRFAIVVPFAGAACVTDKPPRGGLYFWYSDCIQIRVAVYPIVLYQTHPVAPLLVIANEGCP